MKRFFVFVIFCIVILCIDVLAVPAKPGIITLKQPDGTELQVRLCGDENYHYYETLDGKRVKIADGRAQIIDDRAQTIEDRARMSKRRRHSAQVSATNPRRLPHQAERGLVILVEFSDLSFVKTKQNFFDLQNKEGYSDNGATGSARDYFRDVSNGQYTPMFDVYGPYKLSREMAYYGKNDADGNDMHPDQMVVDAVAMLDSIENIDFSDYDTNNDGFIDNIFVYYAGYGENEGAPENTIWAHAWEIYDMYVTGKLEYDGKMLSGYACASELQGVNGTVMTGIGTFCHEFSHVLGLPDFYVTDYMSKHKTAGDWDIMDSGAYLNGGNTPPGYSAHERFYLGWLTPEILNEGGDYKLEELQKSNKAYIITATGEHNLDGGNPDPATYYLLENRQNVGWDRFLPGHGLMLTKTIYDEDKWNDNTPNNNVYSQGYDIIEADGKAPNNNFGKAGDLFPGSAGVTSYTICESQIISDIVENNDVITFSFVDLIVEDVVSDCWEETFDSLLYDGSKDITSDMDDFADNLGWSGYKLFCESGALKVGSSKHKGYVVTPELPFEGDVEVEFVGRGYGDDDIISFEIDGEVVKEVDVISNFTTTTFKLNDFVMNSTIKMYAVSNRFCIDRFKICAVEQDVSVPSEVESNVSLVTSDGFCRLLNLSDEAHVSCYDIAGRLLWRVVASGDFEFKQPQGFFLIRIEEKDKEHILKGL